MPGVVLVGTAFPLLKGLSLNPNCGTKSSQPCYKNRSSTLHHVVQTFTYTCNQTERLLPTIMNEMILRTMSYVIVHKGSGTCITYVSKY